MLLLEKKDIWFDSADGQHKIFSSFFFDPSVKPICVLQISHGMREHIGRYQEFAFFMAENGVVVCGNDHLGHGQSAPTPQDEGFLVRSEFVLQDMFTMNKLARNAYPGLPVILLGHSMGSFFAREYATIHPNTIAALIISGTAGTKGILTNIGIALSKLLGKIKGEHSYSNLLQLVAFSGNLNRIPHPKSKSDWISTDDEIIEKYDADPKCNFRFTINGMLTLFQIFGRVSGREWAERMPKELPILMFQGDQDPVGNYSKGTNYVRRILLASGVKSLEYKLYPGMRHECLNEIDRQQVYIDTLAFVQKIIAKI